MAIIIDQASFETYISNYTNNNAYVVPIGFVNQFAYLLNLYLAQLEDLGIFNFTDLTIDKSYKVPYCQLSYLPIPLWKQINKIEKLELKTGIKTLVQDGENFIIDKTVIDGFAYSQALDFECLGCNCACERVIVNGIYGVDLPTHLLNTLYLIIYNNLGTGTILGSSDCCSNIKSKSSGEGSVTFYEADTSSKLKQPDNIFSYPIINRVVLSIQRKFIKFY